MATKAARAAVYVREIPKGSGKFYVETHWKTRRKAQRMESKKEAIGYRRFIRREMREGRFTMEPPAESQTELGNQEPIFSEYYEKVFRPNHVEKKSGATQKSYKLSFKYLNKAFGTLKLSDVTTALVDDFLSALTKTGRAKNSIRVINSNGRRMYNFAIKREEVQKNPFASMGDSYREAKAKKEIEYLHYDEIPIFKESIRKDFPEFYDFFATAIGTGAREGELKGLQFGDLQLGSERTLTIEPYVVIRRSVDQSGRAKETKTGKIRTVPLNDELIQLLRERRARMLKEWIENGKDDADFSNAWVFPNDAGKPFHGSNLKRRVFRPALLKAELRAMSFHGLRHTFASILLQSGKASLKEISEWLGHSSIVVTADIYGHLEPSTNRSALNVLSVKNSPNKQPVKFAAK